MKNNIAIIVRDGMVVDVVSDHAINYIVVDRNFESTIPNNLVLKSRAQIHVAPDEGLLQKLYENK